jgi:hypothetical protein
MITPMELDQLHSTFQFASAAKKITQNAKINKTTSEEGLTKQLQDHVKTLKHELAQLRQSFVNQQAANLKLRMRFNN